MIKSTLFVFLMIVLLPQKQTKYLIITGEITCKACVIQLNTHLIKNGMKNNTSIVFKDYGQFILNESSLNYYRKELPKANFVFSNNKSLFPKNEKYPYLLKINKSDTMKIIYDSIFYDDNLNLKFLN